MNQRKDDNPFRGHDFCILGDDGNYYRITNKQLVNSQWKPSKPVKAALDRLLIEQGSVLALHPRPEKAVAAGAKAAGVDPEVAIICLLLNFRSLRTKPPEDEE